MNDNSPINPAPKREDLSELLGAYALDALEPSERLGIEGRIDSDPRLRAEADELSQIASLLGVDGAGINELPSGAWDRFATLLDKPTAQAPVVDLSYRRQRRVRQIVMGAAAAAFIGMLIAVAAQQHRIGSLERASGSLERAAASASNAPGAKHADLLESSGQKTALVTVLPDGTGYLDLAALPALDENHVWQLWTVDTSRLVSLGVTRDSSTPMAFHGSPGVRTFAVTVEPLGGSAQATTKPIASGSTN